MIVVKTFVSELQKKIDMLKCQIEVFESKVSQVKTIEEIIERLTLKQINKINGEDLALISESDFKKIIEVVHFRDNDETLNKFINSVEIDRLYAELLLDGKVDKELEQKIALINQLLNKTCNYEVVEKLLSIIYSESSSLTNNNICTFIKDAKK